MNDTIGTSLRRRAEAARRCPPLHGRHGRALAAFDPALSWPPAPRQPSTFSLTPAERLREAERMLSSGWETWEVVAVLVSPEVAA